MEQHFIDLYHGGLLTHFTRNPQNLKSILLEGFVFRPNSNRVIEELFYDLKIDLKAIEIGMICFSEITEDLSYKKNSKMIEDFGPYGIVMNFDWALKLGIKRVIYLPNSGPIYNSFSTLLKNCMPEFSMLKGYLSGFRFNDIRDSLLTNSYLPDIFTNPLWHNLLEILLWAESELNKDEREWRIRAPFKIGGLKDLDKNHQLELQKALDKPGIFRNLLKIEPENVHFLVCPADDKEEIKELLKNTKFDKTVIQTYS